MFTRFGSYVRLGDVLFATMDIPSKTCALHGPGRLLATNDREKEMLWWGMISNVELSRRRPGQPSKMIRGEGGRQGEKEHNNRASSPFTVCGLVSSGLGPVTASCHELPSFSSANMT
jgi:hypothetical protein